MVPLKQYRMSSANASQILTSLIERINMRTCLIAVAVAWALLAYPVLAQDLPDIAEKTEGLDSRAGLFTVYWDETDGRVWLEISDFGQDFLYLESLPYGLGSNDIGLDRGQLGDRMVVRFERYGPRILLVAPNLKYRTPGAPLAEALSVHQAFADGVVWSFEVAAETDGTVLVDATDFVVRDAHGVVFQLKRAGQGTFAFNRDRSTPAPDMLKSFPDNTELEARLTFTSDEPGQYVRDVAALPSSFSVRIRHSLVRLPGPGFQPRVFHPRAGYFGPRFEDYSMPIGEDLTVRYIARHRLVKRNPEAAVSEPIEPIVYYLDPGTPEPVRSALLDGARWWADAFEAAGFRDAYRVEMMPEDADPLDVRYNVIQWVHRATRGWSYGDAVTDPRTGEIIKGHVSLGSLRVRQDYLLAEGLLAPYEGENAAGPPTDEDPMLEMALARIRQLSAHEVGHTIGLAHNFAASNSDRASVMDYPAPLATVAPDGTIDLSAAYAAGIGEWDKLAVRYGYGVPAPGQSEEAFLRGVLQEAEDAGIAFITDNDARPSGAAHPGSNLWDNGTDMIDALRSEMNVRRVALERFGEAVVRAGRPLALAEEVLVPLYLRHRYQIEATVKLLAGMEYAYVVRGENVGAPTVVPGDVQRAAMDALLDVLSPNELVLRKEIVELISPRPFGYPGNRELFERHTGLTFDPYTPAEALATHVTSFILDADRAARLIYQSDTDSSLPSLLDVFDAVQSRFFEADADDATAAEALRVVQQVWLDGLIRLATDPDAAPAVAARTSNAVRRIGDRLAQNTYSDPEVVAWRHHLMSQIRRFVDRPYATSEQENTADIPPGSPIGMGSEGPAHRYARNVAFLWRQAVRDQCGWSPR